MKSRGSSNGGKSMARHRANRTLREHGAEGLGSSGGGVRGTGRWLGL